MAEKKHFSQSLADRLYVAEFDDALLDLKGWKNSRWEGSKLKGLKSRSLGRWKLWWRYNLWFKSCN